MEYREMTVLGSFWVSSSSRRKRYMSCPVCQRWVRKESKPLGIETFQRNVWLCHESHEQRNCMECMGDWGNNRMFHCCANFGPVACNESVLEVADRPNSCEIGLLCYMSRSRSPCPAYFLFTPMVDPLTVKISQLGEEDGPREETWHIPYQWGGSWKVGVSWTEKA